MFSAKKVLSLILSMLLVFSLCGCIGSSDMDSADILSPPKPSGEMLDIKETLEAFVTGKFSLKYPTAGKYRSAYIMSDLMNSGKENFALAFYSILDEENITSMHLNLMKKVDDSWVSISDTAVAATGVEKVELTDLNGDGIKEITVGWNIYGGVDKSVMVYSLKGLSLVPIVQESYSEFLCFDMEQKEKNNLFVLSHNASEGKASAKLYSFEGEEVVDKGSCLLDGQVTTFYTPVASKLSNGSPAVFIDSAKGSGTQTEVVFLKNNTLTRADFIIDESGTLSTYRNMAALCKDINGDDKYDIPLIDSTLTFTPENYDKISATMIKWCSYNGEEFEISSFAAMNYNDGYYIEIPVKWFGKITVEPTVEFRIYTVSIWDTKKNSQIGTLLQVRTVTETEWDKKNNGLETYKEIKRNGGLVYIAMLGSYPGTEKITLEQAKEIIRIIN